MKNIVNPTLAQTTPCGSGARKTSFPGQFTPEPKAGRAGLPPIQWSWASIKLESEWSVLQEGLASTSPGACGVEFMRVEKAASHAYLLTAENCRLPNCTAEYPAHGSLDDSDSVRTEWGAHSVGKVEFHPPIQDEAKR